MLGSLKLIRGSPAVVIADTTCVGVCQLAICKRKIGGDPTFEMGDGLNPYCAATA
jgi:hypothetical protein